MSDGEEFGGRAGCVLALAANVALWILAVALLAGAVRLIAEL